MENAFINFASNKINNSTENTSQLIGFIIYYVIFWVHLTFFNQYPLQCDHVGDEDSFEIHAHIGITLLNQFGQLFVGRHLILIRCQVRGESVFSGVGVHPLLRRHCMSKKSDCLAFELNCRDRGDSNSIT